MLAGPDTSLSARVSRAELVARELEREIVDEREPGERLGTKEDLRKRFGVAVATVNEAVRLLEMRGMIEARPGPGGGVFVARPAARVAFSHMVLGFRSGSTTYEECLEVRDALGPLIDSHAARYHRASDIRELNRIVKDMERVKDDPATFFKSNWLTPAPARHSHSQPAGPHTAAGPGPSQPARARGSRAARLRSFRARPGPSRAARQVSSRTVCRCSRRPGRGYPRDP